MLSIVLFINTIAVENTSEYVNIVRIITSAYLSVSVVLSISKKPSSANPRRNASLISAHGPNSRAIHRPALLYEVSTVSFGDSLVVRMTSVSHGDGIPYPSV